MNDRANQVLPSADAEFGSVHTIEHVINKSRANPTWTKRGWLVNVNEYQSPADLYAEGYRYAGTQAGSLPGG